MDSLDEIFLNSFLKEFDEKEQRKILLSKEERNIAMKKNEQLEPIRKFLDRFVDLGVYVYHNSRFSKEINLKESNFYTEQPFEYYDIDSSPTWAPGISIAFDHPAQVEIAIPNKLEEEGCIAISVATNHPDASILEQKFYSIESACQALAKFIGKNTIKLAVEPRKAIEAIQNTKVPERRTNPYAFMQDVPNGPPDSHNYPSNSKEKKINSEVLRRILEQKEKEKEKGK